jgi:hypothetical protein
MQDDTLTFCFSRRAYIVTFDRALSAGERGRILGQSQNFHVSVDTLAGVRAVVDMALDRAKVDAGVLSIADGLEITSLS